MTTWKYLKDIKRYIPKNDSGVWIIKEGREWGIFISGDGLVELCCTLKDAKETVDSRYYWAFNG